MPERTPEQIALAQRTLAYIEAHPETWDQKGWRCDTGMCFAGWAVTLAGRTWSRPTGGWDEYLMAEPGDDPDCVQVHEDGVDIVHVRWIACTLLGLAYTEADILFGSDNTLKHLRAYVDHIAGSGYLNWTFDSRFKETEETDHA